MFIRKPVGKDSKREKKTTGIPREEYKVCLPSLVSDKLGLYCISVLTVGKVSVTVPISLPIGESTLEKNLISVVNVENASIRAQAL